MYTLIGTAKLNDVDHRTWLAGVLGRIAGTPQSRFDELLPWNWRSSPIGIAVKSARNLHPKAGTAQSLASRIVVSRALAPFQYPEPEATLPQPSVR